MITDVYSPEDGDSRLGIYNLGDNRCPPIATLVLQGKKVMNI